MGDVGDYWNAARSTWLYQRPRRKASATRQPLEARTNPRCPFCAKKMKHETSLRDHVAALHSTTPPPAKETQ